jgi:glutathione S-transferase
MTDKVTLYTNKMCPFAQKAWIALEEKKAVEGLNFAMEEIALYGSGGKPAWFMKMNPNGQVPVLKHGDKVVVESDEIIKYIDSSIGTRAAMSQGTGASVDEWFQLMAQVRSTGKDCVLGYGSTGKLKEVLKKVEQTIQGPYMRGADFSLADVAAAPFFQRMMTEQKQLDLNPSEFPKIYEWWSIVEQRPAFAKTVVKSWWWWW